VKEIKNTFILSTTFYCPQFSAESAKNCDKERAELLEEIKNGLMDASLPQCTPNGDYAVKQFIPWPRPFYYCVKQIDGSETDDESCLNAKEKCVNKHGFSGCK